MSEGLKKRGYSAEGIHGDLTQAKRDSVIRQFREKTIDILVATDVAARGLDISGVTHVYNYDLPQDPESYVHRVGRTGRAGQSGEATTFVIPREIDHLRTIEKLIKHRISRRKAPSFSEALEGAQQTALRNLSTAAEEGDVTAYRASAEELLETYDSVTLVAAAVKLLIKEPDTTPVKITEEAPLRIRRSHGNRNGNSRNSKRRPSGDSHRRLDGRRPAGKSKDGNFRHRSTDRKSGSESRREVKERKEPNRSVFKPYFKS